MPPAELSTATGEDWRDDGLATQWASGDRLEGLLSLPRRITSDLLAHADQPVGTVLDAGSGPGSFLGALLERLPGANGVWTDVSEAMRDIARDRLSRFAERVEYQILEAGDIAGAGPQGSFDAVVTSRLTHHLGPEGLGTFYGDAATLLGPGGWIANLDHVSLPEPWAARLAAARADVVPPNPASHRHDRPHPTLDDHLQALCGLADFDVVVPWRAYSTVLFVARRR